MSNKILILVFLILLVYFIVIKPISSGNAENKKPDLQVNDKVTVRG